MASVWTRLVQLCSWRGSKPDTGSSYGDMWTLATKSWLQHSTGRTHTHANTTERPVCLWTLHKSCFCIKERGHWKGTHWWAILLPIQHQRPLMTTLIIQKPSYCTGKFKNKYQQRAFPQPHHTTYLNHSLLKSQVKRTHTTARSTVKTLFFWSLANLFNKNLSTHCQNKGWCHNLKMNGHPYSRLEAWKLISRLRVAFRVHCK